MMMAIKRLAFGASGFCLLTSTSLVVAQTTSPDTSINCNARAVIYFGNGIQTPFGSALVSLDAIRAAANAKLETSERDSTTYELAYNSSGTFLQDLIEATKQRFALDDIRVRQILLYLAEQSEAPASVKDYLSNYVAQRFASDRVNSSDLGKHIALYKNAISSGKKVVVVAHSQGNFFVNQAYGSLTSDERRSFAIASVANPDIAVAGGGPYVTLLNDLLITLLVGGIGQQAGRPVLPPNTVSTVVPRYANSFGHAFLSAYFTAETSSYDKIIGNIISQYRAIAIPNQAFGQGAIRATLTWGNQPDVDLHAFEPGGSHVYYGSRRGTSGFLDLDDTTSFGPENYFVQCSTVQTGTYRIGVNYFSGTGPETARVEIRAGGNSIIRDQPLQTARGTAGDNSPVIVATVEVTKDSSGRNAYVIK